MPIQEEVVLKALFPPQKSTALRVAFPRPPASGVEPVPISRAGLADISMTTKNPTAERGEFPSTSPLHLAHVAWILGHRSASKSKAVQGEERQTYLNTEARQEGRLQFGAGLTRGVILDLVVLSVTRLRGKHQRCQSL